MIFFSIQLSYLGAELYSILFANDNPTTEKYMNMFRKNHKKITDQVFNTKLSTFSEFFTFLNQIVFK